MLSEFLSQKVIEIKSDEDLEKIQKSAKDIAKRIQKNRHKIINYTIIALDQEADIGNPTFQEVKTSITTKNWKTFSVNPDDTQVSIIRGIIFEALEIISKDINLAALIWLTGRNIQKHNNLVGQEKELVQNFLIELGNQVEQKAAELWAIPSKINVTKINIVPEDTDPALAVEITTQGQIIKIQKEANRILNLLQTELIKKNDFMQLRSQLLWWKESSYSPTIDNNYVNKDGFLQILLALDYSNFIPNIYPKSANYFLKETHKSINGKQGKKIELSTILEKIEENRKELKLILDEPNSSEGKNSLLRFIQNLVWEKTTVSQIKVQVGVNKTIDITLEEFTLWIFHDLQSIKIANSK